MHSQVKAFFIPVSIDRKNERKIFILVTKVRENKIDKIQCDSNKNENVNDLYLSNVLEKVENGVCNEKLFANQLGFFLRFLKVINNVFFKGRCS